MALEQYQLALIELVACYGILQGAARVFPLLSFTRVHSRKLVHMSTGPVHMLFWSLFTSPAWSCVTPLVLTTRLALIAFGWKDARLSAAMLRSGDPKEFLRGPLAYGAVHVLVTLLLFKSPLGVLVLLILCIGDGIAAIAGKEWGASNPLPWNRKKSAAGTLSFVAATIGALAVVGLVTPFNVMAVVLSALVESLPVWGDWDNVAVVVSPLLLRFLVDHNENSIYFY